MKPDAKDYNDCAASEPHQKMRLAARQKAQRELIKLRMRCDMFADQKVESLIEILLMMIEYHVIPRDYADFLNK